MSGYIKYFDNGQKNMSNTIKYVIQLKIYQMSDYTVNLFRMKNIQKLK